MVAKILLQLLLNSDNLNRFSVLTVYFDMTSEFKQKFVKEVIYDPIKLKCLYFQTSLSVFDKKNSFEKEKHVISKCADGFNYGFRFPKKASNVIHMTGIKIDFISVIFIFFLSFSMPLKFKNFR